MNTTRIFATASLLLTFFASVGQLSAREYYELRTYRLKSEEKAQLFDKTLGPAIVEAMEAAAIGPVGIFRPHEVEGAKNQPEKTSEVLRYVFVPYKSIEDWAGIRDQLKDKGAVWEPALEFIMAEKSDANYTRIESMLLEAPTGFPKLKVPAKPVDEEGRHFEIRIYESHSIVKGLLKVEMFNEGEFDIFAKVGLNLVFFGDARVARDLPQLTYMLVYDNDEARAKAWKDFLAHPDWLELKANKRYKDTVSKIRSMFVKATEYSQIK